MYNKTIFCWVNLDLVRSALHRLADEKSKYPPYNNGDTQDDNGKENVVPIVTDDNHSSKVVNCAVEANFIF